MKIFIAQDDGSKDFSKLLSITQDIVICTTRQYPLLSQKSEHVTLIRDRMRDFDPECDVIVLVGDPINIGIVLHLALEKGGDIKLLKWSRFDYSYVPITLTLEEK